MRELRELDWRFIGVFAAVIFLGSFILALAFGVMVNRL